MGKTNNRINTVIIWLCMVGILSAQTAQNLFPAAGTPSNPKVSIAFNRYYDTEGLVELMTKIEKAHPDLVKIESIGKSTEGKDILVLSITDHKAGNPLEKPAFYVDGNIHSNEIQGAELCIYIAWYLTEMHARSDYIRELLRDRTFYIVPTINPDARNNYMHKANSMHSPRAGMIPLDDDLDGRFDEDGYDDLDGDGSVTQMWRKSDEGTWIKDPRDPRKMIPVTPDDQIAAERYEYLGFEGIDNDGDGEVNEDVIGYYDPNRDWGWKWQPDYIQNGAYKYPFSVPETKAVADFVLSHPNIAGAQTFHNNGGMILRGPGVTEDQDTYNTDDIAVYDQIGQKGERILPGYRYITIYKDLYSVFGGEIDWFHGDRGVFIFSNEIFTPFSYFNEENPSMESSLEFSKYLLFDDSFKSLSEVEHPQYGTIEVGGFQKNFTRATPGFLLEEEAHRNMAFVLYHAYHLPKLSIKNVSQIPLGNGLSQITATIVNERLIPTHSSHDVANKITPSDYVTLKGAKVLAGMLVLNEDMNISREQQHSPEKLAITNIPGNGFVKVRWIIKNPRKITIKVTSTKGGTADYKG